MDFALDDDQPSSLLPATKRRYHSVSPYYLFCKRFIEECEKNHRRYFRTEKQGFEAAGLKWNTLTLAEKKAWQSEVRMERKKSPQQEGNQPTKLKMRNGDRGDPNCDPAVLGLVKDLSLKRKRDVNAMVDRWTWKYTRKYAIYDESFLVVSARITGNPPNDECVGFTALAVVQFSLAKGIIDEYRVDFDDKFRGNLANVRYEAVRHVLNWPSKIGRRLGDMAPQFFAAADQMANVFDALTFVDPSDGGNNKCSWGDATKQLSLAKDLANVSDLENALANWFSDESQIQQIVDGDQQKLVEPELCPLTAAREDVVRILDKFSFYQR